MRRVHFHSDKVGWTIRRTVWSAATAVARAEVFRSLRVWDRVRMRSGDLRRRPNVVWELPPVLDVAIWDVEMEIEPARRLLSQVPWTFRSEDQILRLRFHNREARERRTAGSAM